MVAVASAMDTFPSGIRAFEPASNDTESLGEFMPSQSASITASYGLDSRTLVSARYGYKYLNYRTNNYGIPSVAYWLYRTPATDVSGLPAEYIGPAGTQNYAGSFVTFEGCNHAP